jgi:tRNA threonylcarbamoyl adenosine modification protein YeaZ
MQLAIDTSTGMAGLALVQGYRILAEMTWQCGSNHSVELSPRLVTLLEQSKCDVKSLDGIIVALGPGSFNGLRVGVSEAKGMAFALGIPIVGVSTLEATAYAYAPCRLPVCAVQNAGREEIAAAVYQQKPRKGWQKLQEEQIIKPEQLDSWIKTPTLICGEMNEDTLSKIKKVLKSRALLVGPAGQLRRPAFLAELGQIRMAARQFDNLSTLQPLYLRRPPITERKSLV